MPEVYGTAAIAKICRCSPRKVAKWIDEGLLGGYRLPGGKTRRVTRSSLLRFMKQHDMPAEWYAVLETPPCNRPLLPEAA